MDLFRGRTKDSQGARWANSDFGGEQRRGGNGWVNPTWEEFLSGS